MPPSNRRPSSTLRTLPATSASAANRSAIQLPFSGRDCSGVSRNGKEMPTGTSTTTQIRTRSGREPNVRTGTTLLLSSVATGHAVTVVTPQLVTPANSTNRPGRPPHPGRPGRRGGG